MYVPTLINWTSPFPCEGLLGGIVSFLKDDSVRKNWRPGPVLFAYVPQKKTNIGDPDQTPRYVTSDLGPYCLHMSHKKTLGLWVKQFSFSSVMTVI